MRSVEESPHTQLEIDVNSDSPSLKMPDMHSQVDSNGVDCFDDYQTEDPVEPATITSFPEENKKESKSGFSLFNRIFNHNSEHRSVNSTSSGAASAKKKSISSKDVVSMSSWISGKVRKNQ